MTRPSSTPLRLVGRPESPYSVKVRSALRYKRIDYVWLDRFSDAALFHKHARLPLVPLVLLPTGQALQDSTPILEQLDDQGAGPSLHPADPALRFLSEVMEEYGDEWANKLMFYHRWAYPPDQQRCGRSLAAGLLDGNHLGWAKPLLIPVVKRVVIRRMVSRMGLAGASARNAPLLVDSFSTLVDLLESHLSTRHYLFGGQPALGDFGLWGQVYQASLDPTCADLLARRGPAVLDWVRRMEDPQQDGPFEHLGALAPTLRPLFAQEVGPRFLAWSCANEAAWAAGEERTSLQMDGRLFEQQTFTYPARTLAALRDRFAAVAECAELTAFLEETGCLPFLREPAP